MNHTANSHIDTLATREYAESAGVLLLLSAFYPILTRLKLCEQKSSACLYVFFCGDRSGDSERSPFILYVAIFPVIS